MDPGTAIAIIQITERLISTVWKYYSDVKDARVDIMAFLEELRDFGAVVRSLQQSLPRDKSSLQAPELTRLQPHLEECLAEIKSLEQKPFSKAEVEKRTKKLKEFQGRINLALTMDITPKIQAIDQNVNDLGERFDATKLENQLERLPVAFGAVFNSYDQQHESRCLPDTREELLRELMDWGKSHPTPIFWLSGMAGTGKSTISRTIADHFHSVRLLGGTFFFSRSLGEANDARKFVGTLAHCLANVSNELKARMEESLISNKDVLRQDLRSQRRALIIRFLTETKFPNGFRLNFVVDALDECSLDKEIRILIQLFVELKEVDKVDIGVLVTGRPEVPIRLNFNKVYEILHRKLDLRDIPADIIEHDLLVFVQNELGELAKQRNLLDWPQDTQLRALVKKSGNLLIYAATACRFIADISWNPAEIIADIIEGSSADVESVKGLYEMYTQVLESSLISGRSVSGVQKMCDRFKEVVGAIVVLFDKLSIQSLAKLLSRPNSWIEECLVSLHSVLDVPEDTATPIRLLHPSLRDFLLSPPERENGTFHVQERQIHTRLLVQCLDIIGKSLSRNICSLPAVDSSPLDTKPEVLDTKLPRHVRYACCYWVTHLECVSKPTNKDDDLGDKHASQIHEFLLNHFLNWLVIMSLMGCMTQAVLMMTKLAAITQKSRSSSVHAAIDDARKFTLRNRILIEATPLQNSLSALILAPSESEIRKYYIDTLPDWIRMTHFPGSDDVVNEQISWPTRPGWPHSRSQPAFSPDGKTLAIAEIADEHDPCLDIVRLLDISTGEERLSLEIRRDWIYGTPTQVAFANNGNLVTLTYFGILNLWDPITGALLQILDVTFGRPRYSSDENFRDINWFTPLSKGGYAIRCCDDKLRTWNPRTREFSDPLVHFGSSDRLLSLSSCGLLFQSDADRLHTERVCSPSQIERFRSNESEQTMDLADEIDADSVRETAVFYCDYVKGTIQRLEISSPVYPKAAISSTNCAAVESEEGLIQLYRIEDGNCLKSDRLKSDRVTAITFSPNGAFLITEEFHFRRGG